MASDRSDPALLYTLPIQFTEKVYRRIPDHLQPEKEENSQKGRIIVITGGGTGLGAAAAHIWVRAGAEGVVIAGRRQNRLDQTVASLEALSKGRTKILAVSTDLKVEESVTNLFRKVNETFGRPADVVLANAGAASKAEPLGDAPVSEWWDIFSTIVLGQHNTVAAWIKSQPDPKNPVGTLISVSSGLAGIVFPGHADYSIAKLAAQRHIEYVQAEYPGIRAFSVLPGIVKTEILDPMFEPVAGDEADCTGALALYLASPRADYLKGCMTSINWDTEEMEQRKEEIEKGPVGPLKIGWLVSLPLHTQGLPG